MNSDRHATAQARAIWPPEPGFFRVRLVKDGWLVPAQIRLTEDGWQAIVNGCEEAAHADPAQAPQVAFVWTSGLRIEEADYRYLVALAEWAHAYDADHPAADPRRPINVTLLKPIKPRTHTQ